MARYAVRQLGYMALTLLVVSCAVFVLNEFAPGDVARKLLGAYATQEQVEHLTQQLGLDRPVLGRSPLSMGGNWSIASQLVMPVLVMALYDMGYLIAMIRVSMIGVMRQPFIRTAILKGMKRRDVIVKHALRNALIAPFTAILLQINYLIAGVVVVETVFAYPGFGRLMLQAATSKDIALVEAGALVAVLIAMTTQLAGDPS